MTISERTKSKSSVRRRKSAAESTVSEQELRECIAQKAYDLYEKRGQTHGRDLEDWLEAERVLLAELQDKGYQFRRESKDGS